MTGTEPLINILRFWPVDCKGIVPVAKTGMKIIKVLTSPTNCIID
jgi:hypothetical protein